MNNPNPKQKGPGYRRLATSLALCNEDSEDGDFLLEDCLYQIMMDMFLMLTYSRLVIQSSRSKSSKHFSVCQLKLERLI